jgi:hypothetical protein
MLHDRLSASIRGLIVILFSIDGTEKAAWNYYPPGGISMARIAQMTPTAVM